MGTLGAMFNIPNWAAKGAVGRGLMLFMEVSRMPGIGVYGASDGVGVSEGAPGPTGTSEPGFKALGWAP